MPLVQYSDSETSESSVPEKPQKQGVKRKRASREDVSLPSLPDSFHDLYASTTRVSNQDDPTLHGGRQRVTPHVEGNWPTHIYIEWYPSTENSNRLNDLLASVNQVHYSSENEVYSLLKSDLGAELPLHISLSRPITLLTHQRQPFIDALTGRITKSNLQPFEVSVHALDWVPNYEKTRWFLVMKLDKPPHDELNQLLNVSNTAAQSFGQPPLYAEPQQPSSLTGIRHPERKKPSQSSSSNILTSASPHFLSSSQQAAGSTDMSSAFHLSIAWTLNPPPQALIDYVQRSEHDIQGMKIDVQAAKAKIGNQITSVSLASKVDSSNGIIEK